MFKIRKRFSQYLVILLVISRSISAQEKPSVFFQDCSDCPHMVRILPGHFLMGSSDVDSARDLSAVPAPSFGLATMLGITEQKMAVNAIRHEHPQHMVQFDKGFALGRFFVTREEFSVFAKQTGYVTAQCESWGHPGLRHLTTGAWAHPGFEQANLEPVVCVSWEDAKAYIAWLNKKVKSISEIDQTGPYRLPSEAEWEYAARAKTQTSRWWGDDVGTGRANCDGCGPFNGQRQTSSFGTFLPNQFDLFDMLGNAWELIEDCYSNDYSKRSTSTDPVEGDDCQKRVIRGGAWDSTPAFVRSALRSSAIFNHAQNDVGFRVAKDVSE